MHPTLLTKPARLQLRPKQYDREKDERNADGNGADDGLYGHCLAPSVSKEANCGAMATGRFDLGQTAGPARELSTLSAMLTAANDVSTI